MVMQRKMSSRAVFWTVLGVLFLFSGLKPATAQVTDIFEPFTGDVSETWESFPNYNNPSFHFLPDSTTILNGIASISNPEMVIYEYTIADIVLGNLGVALVSDGTKGLVLDNIASTATIKLAEPISTFGAYWGAAAFGSPAKVSVTFYDTTGNFIDSVFFTYGDGNTQDAGLAWHGWASPSPIGRIEITGDFVAMDGLQVNLFGVCVAGNVNLETCLHPETQIVNFEFRSTTSTNKFTVSTTLKSDGSYKLPSIPSGTYLVAIKGSKWLQKVIKVDTTGGNVSGADVLLPAGDANNDNHCNLDDLGALSLAFDTKIGDALFDDGADFYCNGTVDLDDLGALSLNFDTDGDN